MRKISLQILFITSLILLIGCTKSETDSTVIEPENSNDYSGELTKLFPVNVGNSFTYSVDTMNALTQSYDNIGSRELSVENKLSDGEYDNFICLENYLMSNSTNQTQSKFRVTENSIDFFPNVSGVSELIPDSIAIEIEIILDEVFKMVEYPYADGHEWSVFKAGANFGTFKFNIFSVTGIYVGSEILQLAGFDNTINTEKFKYTVSLNIPDISNPFISNANDYEAFLWLSPDVGVVKLEGCKMFVDPITALQFDDADSNKVMRHTLISNN